MVASCFPQLELAQYSPKRGDGSSLNIPNPSPMQPQSRCNPKFLKSFILPPSSHGETKLGMTTKKSQQSFGRERLALSRNSPAPVLFQSRKQNPWSVQGVYPSISSFRDSKGAYEGKSHCSPSSKKGLKRRLSVGLQWLVSGHWAGRPPLAAHYALRHWIVSLVALAWNPKLGSCSCTRCLKGHWRASSFRSHRLKFKA